jgi:hypothetical protein
MTGAKTRTHAGDNHWIRRAEKQRIIPLMQPIKKHFGIIAVTY